MAMVAQQVQLPFTGGIDQGQAQEYLDPAVRILSLVNGNYRHDGAAEKRFGIRALTSAVPANFPQIGTPLACFTRGPSLLATDGDGLYAYTPGVSGWTNVGGAAGLNPGNPGLPSIYGTMPQCTGTRTPLQAFILQNGQPIAPAAVGIAEGSGVRLVTYQSIGTGGVVSGTGAILYDLATGAVISNNLFGSGPNTYNPIPIIIGGYAYVFFSDSGHIYWQQVDLAAQTFLQGTLVSDAANQFFDATPEVLNSGGTWTANGIVIAYNQTGHLGAPRYLRLENLPALTITASGYVADDNAHVSPAYSDVITVRSDYQLGVTYFAWENAAGISAPANSILVAAYNTPGWTQIDLGGVSSAFHAVPPGYTDGGTAFAQQICVEPLNSTEFYVNCFWGGYPTSYTTPVGQVVYNTSGQQLSTNQYPDVWIGGRPFRVEVASVTRLYLPVASYEQIQSASGAFQFCTVHLMDTRAYEGNSFQPPSSGNPRVVTSIANRQASEAFYGATSLIGAWRPTMVTSIGNPLATNYRLPIGILPSEEWQTSVAQPQPVVMWLANFDFAPTYSYAEGNGETYIGGCLPSMYAGQGFNEEGFHMWPSRMTPTQTTGGNLTLTSTYGYAFVFSEVDSGGALIHRSAPYLATVTLTAGNDQVDWVIPGIAYTQRTNVVIEVYRTQANLSTYYYEGNVSAYASSGILGTINYTSSASDGSIASNTTLYTTGGALPALAPPCFRHRIKHLERHYGIDDTGLVVYFSQNFNASDAPYYHDSLTFQFTEETLVAMASLDGNFFIGSANHIWYIQGYGPNALGTNSDAPPEPTLLPSDVGFASPQSIVTFPGGFMFQAPSGGIYLLDRSLNVSYVGRAVQDTVNSQTVTSASLVPGTHDIRFILSGGTVVTYDYVLGRWATCSYVNSGTLTSAIVDNSQLWTACSSDGHIYQEKTSSSSAPYMDTNAAGSNFWVTLSVTSAHVKLGGLQGYQRLRHLLGYATFLDPADLNVTITYDYGVTTQSATFTYGNLFAANPIAAQWDLHAQAISGKAMACQVITSDASPTGGTATTGQGCRLLGLSFDVQSLAARNMRLPAVVKL